MGVQGLQGTPRPIRLLITATAWDRDLELMVLVANRDQMFPLGSQIDYVNISDGIPSLATLSKYDAIYCWSGSPFPDPVAFGDRLAEYVDGGGGLVISQFAYSIPAALPAAKGPLKGRVMTPAYCPLTATSIIGSDNLGNKKIDVNSLGFPLHPIFNVAHDGLIDFFAQSDFSDPGLDATATLLAKDTKGDNAVAINAAGNIIGLDFLGWWGFQDTYSGSAPFPEANQVVRNALLWVAGAY
jgi:hypothetical protein